MDVLPGRKQPEISKHYGALREESVRTGVTAILPATGAHSRHPIGVYQIAEQIGEGGPVLICSDDVSLSDYAGSIRNPSHGASIMSIVVRFSPIALTTNKYDEAIRQIENAGEWPPAGLDYHVCFGSDGNLKVSEIWNSREQFEAFDKRLMPILAGVGIQLANPPDIFDVHNIVKG